MDHIIHRLDALKRRTANDYDFLLNALAAQRERFDRAFDEMKFAWLEQEVSLHGYASQSRSQSDELRETIQALAQHVDERLTRLERNQPPAA